MDLKKSAQKIKERKNSGSVVVLLLRPTLCMFINTQLDRERLKWWTEMRQSVRVAGPVPLKVVNGSDDRCRQLKQSTVASNQT